MKKIILAAYCLSIFATAFTQDAKTYYKQGFEKEQDKKFTEAIKLFDRAIELDRQLTAAWIERGNAKNNLSLFGDAITDFSEAIKIDSNYKVAWLNRGSTKVQTGDYQGALTDLDHAILLDSNLANAYYARGFANEKLGNADAACIDFKTALRLGITSVQDKVDLCNGKIKGTNNQKNILVLTDEGNQQKLVALGPQLIVKVKDTLMAIVFFLMQSPTNTNVLGSLHPALVSDSLSFIELLLANGETMKLNRAPHNKPSSKSEPLIFMALFDHQQNRLLIENNIQKISFHSAGDGYEYTLKDKY